MIGRFEASARVTVEYDAPEHIGGIMRAGTPTLAVLEWTVTRGEAATPEQVDRLAQWCALHTRAVLVDGARVEGELAYLLDSWLHVGDLIGLAQALMTAERLPDEMVSAARSFLDTLAAGGCECPACAGEQESHPRCAIASTPPAVRDMVLTWWPMREHIDYDMPIWAYQLHQQWSDSSARATLARREEAERRRRLRDHARGRLRSMGLRA